MELWHGCGVLQDELILQILGLLENKGDSPDSLVWFLQNVGVESKLADALVMYMVNLGLLSENESGELVADQLVAYQLNCRPTQEV